MTAYSTSCVLFTTTIETQNRAADMIFSRMKFTVKDIVP